MSSSADGEADEDEDSRSLELDNRLAENSYPLKIKSTFIEELSVDNAAPHQEKFRKRQVSESSLQVSASFGEPIGLLSRFPLGSLSTSDETEEDVSEPMRVQTLAETVQSLAETMARLVHALPEAEAVVGDSSLLSGGETLHSSMDDAVAPPDWGETTTVMMRNLPNKYTQRMLLTEINHTGFLGTFDFLYLPIDPETTANRGYAFLNFIDPSFAWMFKRNYDGRKMNRFNSNKVVSVVAATLQGFEANYAHYASARVNRGDPASRPLFLREPKQGNSSVGIGGPGGSRRGGRRRANSDEAFPKHGLLEAWESSYGYDAAFTVPYSALAADFRAMNGVNGTEFEAAGRLDTASNIPKFCPHCGSSIQPRFQFCPSCGASLVSSVTVG